MNKYDSRRVYTQYDINSPGTAQYIRLHTHITLRCAGPGERACVYDVDMLIYA